ncbi:MAG: hypothetical protein ACRC78_12575 [Planktothrix sp.]
MKIFVKHPDDMEPGFSYFDFTKITSFNYFAGSSFDDGKSRINIYWEGEELPTKFKGKIATNLASYLKDSLTPSDEFIDLLSPEDLIKFDFTY